MRCYAVQAARSAEKMLAAEEKALEAAAAARQQLWQSRYGRGDRDGGCDAIVAARRRGSLVESEGGASDGEADDRLGRSIA